MESTDRETGGTGGVGESAGEFVKYVAVSGGGLAVDVAALAFGVEILGLPLLTANAISFSLGVVVVYLGSIFWVFNRRRLSNPRTEFILFAAIGLVGLGVNQLALWSVVTATGAFYGLGKLAAAAASFVANFIIRKWVLFR